MKNSYSLFVHLNVVVVVADSCVIALKVQLKNIKNSKLSKCFEIASHIIRSLAHSLIHSSFRLCFALMFFSHDYEAVAS
jgi:hypothetical protein